MNNDSVSLSDYLRVIRRRWLTIATTVVLVGAGVLAYTAVRTPEYRSIADVELEYASSEGQVPNPAIRSEELATQQFVATSERVTQRVREDLDRDIPFEDVTASMVPETRVLRITASADSPEVAARIADAYAEHYLRFRREQLDERSRNHLESLRNREKSLERKLATVGDEIADAEDEQQTRALEQDRANLQQELNNVSSQVADRRSEPASDPGTVIRSANPNTAPINPKPKRDMALAMVLALLLGGAIAFTRDHFDDSIHDQKMLRRALGDRTVLGAIPAFRRRGRAGALVTADDPRSGAAEAYQSLAANLRGVLAGGPPHRGQTGAGRTVLVTSATRRENVAAVAANLAIANARAGLRVALVDADFRQPGIGQLFEHAKLLPPDVGGLSEVVARRAELDERCREVEIRNLVVLPAGPEPTAPTEMLADPRTSAVLGELALRTDLVVVSSAPTQFADPVELGLRMDLLLLVIGGGITRSRQAADAASQLDNVGAPIGIAFDGSSRPGLFSLR